MFAWRCSYFSANAALRGRAFAQQFQRAFAFASAGTITVYSWSWLWQRPSGPNARTRQPRGTLTCEQLSQGMRLYYSPASSASLRVLLALRCKGVHSSRMQLVKLEAASGAHGEAFWQLPRDDQETKRLGTTNYFALTAEGLVPLLLVGSQKLTQSAAIISLIEDMFRGDSTRALIPKDSLSRARAWQIVNIVQCDIQPLQDMGFIVRATRDFGMTGEASFSHPFRLNVIRRGLEGLEAIVKESSGHFCVGNDLTIADVFLVPQLRNALNAGIEIAEEFPCLHSIWIHCLGRPEIYGTLKEFGGIPPAYAALHAGKGEPATTS